MKGSGVNKRDCGCAGARTGAGSASRSKPAGDGCGCGCGGCGSCAGLESEDVGCSSGTPEATDRKGPSSVSCLPERPRFFPGEMVTDFDLTALVDYQRAQSLLSNAVIGGWGVYSGYSLSIDADSCSVCVGPGIAFDARGRALVRASSAKLRRPAAPDVGRPRAACDPCVKPPPDETFFLAVVYDDCLGAPKPRYGNACGPSSDPGCDFSRIQERARLVWLNPNTVLESYWTSGCLTDPCSEPEPRKCSPEAPAACSEPDLDWCTPDIGIHGGLGVDRYAKAMQNEWNLPRNAALVQQNATSEATTGCSSVGVGALIDVISGVACPPCDGEALIILAEVSFSTDAESKRPIIRVLPLRRRVLSNADLTYVVGFLLERALCPPASPETSPTAPPSFQEICGDPCARLKPDLERILDIAAGEDAELRRAIGEKLAYRAVMGSERSVASLRAEEIVDVLREVRGPAFSRADEKVVHSRYQKIVGRAAYEDASREMIEKLAIANLSEEDRARAKEYLTEQFAQLRGTHRTIAWRQFLTLARKVHDIAGVELGEAKIRRLAADYPEALVPDDRMHGMAEEMARQQLERVMSELAGVRQELASAKANQALPTLRVEATAPGLQTPTEPEPARQSADSSPLVPRETERQAPRAEATQDEAAAPSATASQTPEKPAAHQDPRRAQQARTKKRGS